jgi:hypothetical protein
MIVRIFVSVWRYCHDYSGVMEVRDGNEIRERRPADTGRSIRQWAHGDDLGRLDPDNVVRLVSEDRVMRGASYPLPLVDVVAHAKAVYGGARNRRSDIITTATIYGAAVLATAGFAIAAVVDELLQPRRGGFAQAR